MEAAVIVPLLAFLFAALIALCFYAHDRAWFTGAACEAALAANASENAAEEAWERVDLRLEERILPGDPPVPEVSAGRGGTGISFEGERIFGLPWEMPPWKVSVSVRRIHPAGALQNWWAAKRFGRELLETEEE